MSIGKNSNQKKPLSNYEENNYSSHLKPLTFKGYQKYLDKYWRAGEMFMINHQTGKNTKLIWTNYKFRTGLKDKDFNKNSLKRAR